MKRLSLPLAKTLKYTLTKKTFGRIFSRTQSYTNYIILSLLLKRHFHCSYTDLGVLKDFIQDNSFITTQHQDTQLINKGQLVYKKIKLTKNICKNSFIIKIR